jgi:nucleoside-diphosphate-sugar epimerase
VTGAPRTEEELDERLSEPRDATVRALSTCPGDIIVLGAGGKMGPTLARMAARAVSRGASARTRRVIAVSRFASGETERALNDAGIKTIQCDLLDRDAVRRLPDAPNVVFMAGQKFGTTEAPERTWLMNVVVPAICAERYATSRIVAFSTGNVYPLMPVISDGARETDLPAPVGEYAASCLGRERIFEGAAAKGTPGARVAIVRLNYAIDLRYGVLADLASRVVAGTPIPLAMGFVNVIWQGDANRAALELLPQASSPALVVNVTGAERLSVRWLATELGARLGHAPVFEGHEAGDALLSDASLMTSLLPRPEVSIAQMLDWTAAWTTAGGARLGKPTHFNARDGQF